MPFAPILGSVHHTTPMNSTTLPFPLTAADDPTVTLAFSPREIGLLLTALNAADSYMKSKDRYFARVDQEAWSTLLYYVKDRALEHRM